MPPNTNALLLRALSAEADFLSCDAAKREFPVLLRPIAERRRVTSVEFRPLLVDAMLTTHQEGFRIIFNTNGDPASNLQYLFESENSERLLPSRLRFSLAHEIAHTFFYDLSEGAPIVAKRFRAGGGRDELQKLERNCNRLAAHLLLPSPMVKAALKKMKAISPDCLLELADEAGVSIEVLVRRLSDQSTLLDDPYFRGCIVLVKQKDNDPIIVCVARPSRLNIASDLLRLRPGEKWQISSSNGTVITPETLEPTSQICLTVETPQSASRRLYRVAAERIPRFDSASSFLATFEEIENR